MTRTRAWLWLLVGSLCFLLSLGVVLTRQPLKRSVFDGEIPASDPRVQSFNLVKHELPNQEWVGVIVRSERSILNPATLRLIEAITVQFAKTPSLVPESLRSLTRVKVIIPGQEALATQPLIAPEHFVNPASLAQVRRELDRNPLLQRELIARNEQATVIGGYLSAGFEQAAVAHHLNQFAVALARPGIEILPVGNTVANQAMDEGIEAQSTTFVGIGLGILFLVFIWLRMFMAGVWAVILLVVGLVELKAVQIGLGFPDSVVLAATPLLLIALGVSYYFYLAREAAQSGVATAQARLLRPTWFSALATAVGFGTLYSFQILSIREFGLVTALGILIVLFNVQTVYPALLSLWPRLVPAPAPSGRNLFVTFTQRLLAFGRQALAIGLVLLALVFAAIGVKYKLHTNTDPFRFFPPDHQVVRALKALEQFGGNSELIIAIQPRANPDGLPWTPAMFNRLYALEQRLLKLPHVGDMVGYATVADDVAGKFYPPAMRTKERFPVHVVGLMERLLSSPELDRVISLDQQTVFIHVWATAWASDDVEVLIEQIRSEVHQTLGPGYQDIARVGLKPAPAFALGGFDTLWVAIGDYIVQGKLANFWWAILAMPFLAFPFIGAGGQGWRGRVTRSIIVTVPLGVALIETLGLMGWMGIQLDLATCVIASIGIGVGEDFAIHLLSYYDRHGSFEWAAAENAELLTYALLTAAVFAPFSFSVFLPLRQFAWLVTVILVLSYLNAMLLVPIGVRAAKKLEGWIQKIG